MKGNKQKRELTEQEKKDYIPLKEAILYGSAEIYGGGSATLISLVLLFYLNMVLGIAPAVAGAIIMVSKAWDAISDPLMGVISDNTRSKWGRRKPYMVAGGILTFFAMLWLFAPIRNLRSGLKIAIATVGYIFFCTANTISQVPFCSLASDISSSAEQRNKANTIKLVFSMLGAAICFLIPTIIIDKQRDLLDTNPNQVQMTMFYFFGILFAILFAVPLIASGVFSKERAPYDKNIKNKFSFKSYIDPFKIKSYKWHLIMYISAFLCMDIISALVTYYAKIVIPKGTKLFGNLELGTTTIVAPMMVAAALIIPLSIYLSRKKSKQFAYRIGLPLYILGGVIICSYQPSWPAWIIPLFAAIMGLGLGGAQSMPWIVFPDTVDVAELKTGERQTGTFSGLMTFSRKLTQAIAIFLVGVVLQACGLKEKDNAMTWTSVTPKAIRILMASVIIVFMSIGFIASIRYKVTSKKLSRIRYYLDKAREGNDENVLTEEEIKEKQELIKELV